MAPLRRKHQVHILTSANQNLARRVSQANERVTELQGVVHSLKNGYSHDAALLWQQDTLLDTKRNHNIAGNVVVVARDNASSTTIADTLATDKPVFNHKRGRSVYRMVVGKKGRAGVSSVKCFLNDVRNRVPPAWKVQRQRTLVTMQRERSLQIINSHIQEILSSEPSLAGMKSHVASNGTAIYLSYADRQRALDPKDTDAPAFMYPVWLHFTFDPSLMNGTGGLNYQTPTRIDNNVIKAFIHTIVPFGNDHTMNAFNTTTNNNSDNNNNNNNNNNNKNNGEFSYVANHASDSTKLFFLGLTSLFLSLINMRANCYGNSIEGSRGNALNDSQDHIENNLTDDDETDDSWT